MNTCRSVSRSSVARGVLLSSLIATGELFVEGRPGPTGVLRPRQTQSSTATTSVDTDDTDTDTDDDDDDDVDEDGEDGPVTHSNGIIVHHSGTLTWTSTLSGGNGPLSTHSLGGTAPAGSLPTGSGGGFFNPTGSSGNDNDPAEATINGGNAALAASGGGISGGAIGGIVIGVGSILGIGFFLFRCSKRRRAMKKRREVTKRDLLLGPPYVRATHPTDIKDPQMTTANNSSSRRSGLYRTPSRNTLPQIPFDTPAYMSTDNLASYAYAQTHMQRDSTVLSYSSPIDSSGTTTVRESTGFGHASLHEELLVRQKELEARMEQMHESRSDSSDWNHSVSTMNPPPPQYREH